MMLSEEEIEAAENGMDPTQVGKQRGLSNSKNRKWPGGVVPYILDKDADSVFKRGAIFSAMREWEEKTCIKRTTQKDYIEFTVKKGCWSFVGRIGGKQDISLGLGCGYHGIAVHEIGHALGFWHEQSRPDHEKYVEIIWDNIIPSEKHNFKKCTSSTNNSLNVPYDYESIMHYGKRDFSKFSLFF